MKRFAAGLALGALLAAAGAAGAQVSSQGGPVQLTADHFASDQEGHVVTYDGRVEVLQANARLRADHVKITFSGGGDGAFGAITGIEAAGNVYYVVRYETSQRIVRGDRAVYEQASDVLSVTGAVILQDGRNVMTGTHLSVQVGKGITTLDANGDAATNGRVRGVFYPEPDKKP